MGIEGRTQAEIRKEAMLAEASAEAEGESLPSLTSSEEEAPQEEEDEEQAANKRVIRRVSQIDLDEDEAGGAGSRMRRPHDLTWTEKAILTTWLRRARQSLGAPQLSNWAHANAQPAEPTLPPPPPLPGGGDGAGGESRGESHDNSVHFT